MLFDPLHVLADLGDFLKGHENAFLLAFWSCGGAQDALTGGYILGDAGLRANHGMFADVNVVHNSGLSGDDHIVSRAAGTCDAHLANENVVPANPTIVADLNEIVDLGSFSDLGGLKCSSVNRGAGPDLDVVANFHVSQLGDLDVPAVVQTIAEAIGADHSVGMNDDTTPQNGPIVKNRVRVNDHVVAKAAESADGHTTVNAAPGPDNAAFSHRGKWMNTGVRSDLCRGMNDRSSIDPMDGRLGPPMQMTDNGYEGVERVVHLDHRQSVGGDGRWDDGRGSFATAQPGRVFLILDEGDIAANGFAQGPGRRDDQVGVTKYFSLDQFRQLSKGGAHARTSFLP
jgi:hypothetical protein